MASRRRLIWVALLVVGQGCKGPTVGPSLDGAASRGESGLPGGAGGQPGGAGGGGGAGGMAPGSDAAPRDAAARDSAPASDAAPADAPVGPPGCQRCAAGCVQGLCRLERLRKPPSAGNRIARGAAQLDGNRLYFLEDLQDRGRFEVKSMSKQGGEEAPLLAGGSECGNDCAQLSLALDANDLFFFSFSFDLTGEKLLAVPKAAGAARLVTNRGLISAPMQVTLVGDRLYWFEEDGIHGCPKAGGPSAKLASGSGYVNRMVAGAGTLVWARKEPGTVTEVDVTSAMSTVLGTLDRTICDVAADGTAAYWIECTWPFRVYAKQSPMAQLVAQATVAGAPPQSVDRGSVAIDGNLLYFLEDDRLNRVPRSGGDVQSIARNEDDDGVGADQIVGFDDTYVFLKSRGARLFRTPK